MEFKLNLEELHNDYERLKAENFHLKRQLKNKNNLMNGKDKYIKKLEKQIKQMKPIKQQYKNVKRGKMK